MKKNNNHNTNSKSNIKVAFFLNFGFAIVEIIGGYFINSIAIMSDALHDLGDSLSLGLAWFLDDYSKKKENENYTYGYRRYSLLAALINTIVLIVGSIIIIWNAVPRLINPQVTSAKGMIGFSILGIIVNTLAVLKTRGGKSLNEKVVNWHLLEDVLGWIAVLIAGVVMYFKDIPILDPLLSIGITIYILYNVVINFKKTILLFLQHVPEEIDLKEIKKEFKSIDNVVDIHHTHIWSLDSEYHVLSTHIVVDKDLKREDIIRVKRQIREKLKDLNIEHITIEIEYDDCKDHE